ncbi:hypothetical protein I316_05553 [Kwoniella heveanensis BCC8398]|uniref:tRNA-intron lyase n=1 Tax=Kwoniella heveanensis BCC8398 TaxID=1296120 RepID=A0A1B9GPI2_9TREE|nr:hypothetical protein I316_05553 [Kwoniella heveanensis BCC8398]
MSAVGPAPVPATAAAAGPSTPIRGGSNHATPATAEAGPSTPSSSTPRKATTGTAPAPVPSSPNAAAAAAAAAKNAGRARFLANQKKYGTPLPILFLQSQSQSSLPRSAPRPTVLSSYLPSLSNSLSSISGAQSQNRVTIANIVGVYDPITRSVWIEDEQSKDWAFCKGFFGKGSLSRSEPSWRDRRIGLLKGGAALAAEQMREQRRLARKQFKMDRAQAMLSAAKQAEAVLTSTVSGSGSGSATPSANASTPVLPSQALALLPEDGQAEDENDTIDEGRPSSPAPSTSTTLDSTTVIDPTSLTPQTFLVRPTRPDANRNRGRKAFRRRPAPAAATQSTEGSAPSVAQPVALTLPLVAEQEEDDQEEEAEDLFDESLVEEMEHLQLSLEEAIFLSLGLGVLKILDPATQTYLPPGPALLSLLLTPPSSSLSLTSPLSSSTPMLPDDPLLVSYVAYHHFRSIGWVVKDGIKFCCDWLLYRRGPVFSHSAFACVVIPVYNDPQDKVSSPYGNEDWYEERMSWKWMNTIMRVNSLVQKTVIAVYVTIPAVSSFPQRNRLPNGRLDPAKNDLSSMLRRYTVREVSMTRFGPSRRRD